MAITDNGITVVDPPLASNKWFLSLTSADLSGCETIKASVTGSYHYLQRIIIHCASAITVSIGAGKTGSDLTTTYLGPISFTTSGPRFEMDFGGRGLKIPLSTALNVDASGAGNVNIYVEGRTGPG